MFKIEITEFGEHDGTITKKWEVLSHKGGEPQYGYTPETTGKVAFRREVLTQEVEALDIPAVIRAVNGL